MIRRTVPRYVGSARFFGTDGNPLGPLFSKGYFAIGFVVCGLYMFSATDMATQNLKPPENLSPELAKIRDLQTDPARPPWPLLHQRVVLMREGLQPLDELSVSWEQTKHFY